MRAWLRDEMKFWTLAAGLSFIWCCSTAQGVAAGALLTCALNGVNLWGEVEVVDSFPDFKVQIVDSFPDLKVQLVDSFPDACGQWKIVSSSGKIKIQYVDSFPDFTIQFVDSFPGLP